MAKKGKVTKKQTKEAIERPIRFKKYKQFILIVCEDENTEPTYFNQFKKLFPEHTMYVEAVGTGRDPLGVVNASLVERKELEEKCQKEIDFVWVVFDKDDADQDKKKLQRFQQALAIAKQEKIKVAYSNEVFELWLILHLSNISSAKPIPRTQIYSMFNPLINKFGGKYSAFNYVHGNNDIIEIISKLGNETKAIERSEKLLKYHQGKQVVDSNPSTMVHVLVQELRSFIDFYSWQP